MQDSTELERLLAAKLEINAHISDSHGDVLSLGFRDGATLYIWAFEDTTNLEAIAIGSNGQITGDFRSGPCREESNKAISQFPDLGSWVVVHREDVPTLVGARIGDGFVCGKCQKITSVEMEERRAWYCAWCGARQRVPGLGML